MEKKILHVRIGAQVYRDAINTLLVQASETLNEEEAKFNEYLQEYNDHTTYSLKELNRILVAAQQSWAKLSNRDRKRCVRPEMGHPLRTGAQFTIPEVIQLGIDREATNLPDSVTMRRLHSEFTYSIDYGSKPTFYDQPRESVRTLERRHEEASNMLPDSNVDLTGREAVELNIDITQLEVWYE